MRRPGCRRSNPFIPTSRCARGNPRPSNASPSATQSASLVEFVAQRGAIDTDLGRKGKTGILENMATRAAFLQDPTHRIRFVYTPKHCSWLNQVEIWFGILTRRLLKRGRFASTDELKQRILDFIDFFNQTLAKPFRWTSIGKPLRA